MTQIRAVNGQVWRTSSATPDEIFEAMTGQWLTITDKGKKAFVQVAHIVSVSDLDEA